MPMDLEKSQIASVLTGMSIFCGILIIPFPVGVYYITRVVVCVGAIYAAIKIKKHFPEEFNRVVFLWFLAFLFNPLLPLYFQARPIWIILDIVALIAFYSSAQLFKNSRPLPESEDRETKKETRELNKVYKLNFDEPGEVWDEVDLEEERKKDAKREFFTEKEFSEWLEQSYVDLIFDRNKKAYRQPIDREEIEEIEDQKRAVQEYLKGNEISPQSSIQIGNIMYDYGILVDKKVPLNDDYRPKVSRKIKITEDIFKKERKKQPEEFKNESQQESELETSIRYFFEVVKEIYEGNFNVREANLFRGRFQTENNFKLGLWKITRIESEAISFASHHNEIIISQVFSRGKLQKDHPKVVEVKDYLKTIV